MQAIPREDVAERLDRDRTGRDRRGEHLRVRSWVVLRHGDLAPIARVEPGTLEPLLRGGLVRPGGVALGPNRGGGGIDTVNYEPTGVFLNRHDGVTVTTDGVANDGFAGDDDNVGSDVENIQGTTGDDSLTTAAGVLTGLTGDDPLTITTGGGAEYGAAGMDELHA